MLTIMTFAVVQKGEPMAELKIPVKVDIAGIEKLIDELKGLQTYKMHEGDDQILVDRDEVVRIFADHVKAEAAQSNTHNTLQSIGSVGDAIRWIPVAERLPKQGQEVVCQCRASIIKVLKLDADGDWYQDADHCYMGGFVLAWMPLPEPWRGEEHEQSRE